MKKTASQFGCWVRSAALLARTYVGLVVVSVGLAFPLLGGQERGNRPNADKKQADSSAPVKEPAQALQVHEVDQATLTGRKSVRKGLVPDDLFGQQRLHLVYYPPKQFPFSYSGLAPQNFASLPVAPTDLSPRSAALGRFDFVCSAKIFAVVHRHRFLSGTIK